MRQIALAPIFVFVCALLTMGQSYNTCSDYNKITTDYFDPTPGTANHSSGYHLATGSMQMTCSWTSVGLPSCANTCVATGSVTEVDSGSLNTPLYSHNIGYNWVGGVASAPNGGATSQCGGTDAATVTACLLTCAASISFSVGANGVGASVSFPPSQIYAVSTPYQVTCANLPDPTYLNSIAVSPASVSAAVGATQKFTALGTYADGSTKTLTNALWTSSSPGVATIGGGSGLATGIAAGTTTITASSSGRSGAATLSVTGGGEGGGGGGGGNCGNGGCGGQAGGGCGSPIIIDANGEGFHMTDVADGVLFDIRGDGTPVEMGWTARDSRNAFLALDRNHNGKIDSGEELFGNYTPQPKSKEANGYAALAEFDKPENGGNGDGVINEKDAIYSKLLLWIDENHDGISQPNELHHLWELGVFSLSLKYVDTPHRDGFGNWFRYKGKVNPLGEPGSDPVDRTSYDVFFELQAPGPRPTSCQ